jgi:hypothetical protein
LISTTGGWCCGLGEGEGKGITHFSPTVADLLLTRKSFFYSEQTQPISQLDFAQQKNIA